MINLKDIPSGALMSVSAFPALNSETDQVYAAFVAPTDCKILGVWITFDAAVTGAATNHRTMEIFDGGADGTGTTGLGTAVSYDNGTNAGANDPVALVAASDLETLDAGDVLLLSSQEEGTGMSMSAGRVFVCYWPTGETVAT